MAGAAVKLETGHVLDERYHLHEVIGRGGMGTVFSARHLELDEMVAVKVLQSENARATIDAEHLERFLREARLAAKIKNEHVVRIIDVARGKDGSPPYIVMELLDGIDLGELVRGLGKVPIPDAVDYVLQACEALAEAHALGIVHRDLKSSNLHLTRHPDGSATVKILDFGISKAHDEESDTNLTATSAVFGSPAYMSPEQIRSAKHVDHRTDIWALAIVLYELITNDLPFVGDTAPAMLASISADPPIPARKFTPETPVELDRAIHAALKKDREKRTQSVAAFAASIAPFGGPNAQASLAAVHRATNRASTRSHQQGSLRPPPIEPESIEASTGPVSDTMRVGSELAAPAPAPVAIPAPAPSGRSDAVARTDREMVIPTRAGSTTSIAAMVGIGGIVLGVLLGGGALFFVMRRGSAPPRKPAVVATQPPPRAEPAIPPPPRPPAPAPVAEPAVSSFELDTPSPRNRPRSARPHPNPPASPVPSAKVHATVDTSSRE